MLCAILLHSLLHSLWYKESYNWHTLYYIVPQYISVPILPRIKPWLYIILLLITSSVIIASYILYHLYYIVPPLITGMHPYVFCLCAVCNFPKCSVIYRKCIEEYHILLSTSYKLRLASGFYHVKMPAAIYLYYLALECLCFILSGRLGSLC